MINLNGILLFRLVALIFEPSERPKIPWQKETIKLFLLDGKIYIAMVSLHQRQLWLSFNALKAIIARHGISMVCVGDNDPN
jgi:hypothetical protein